MGSVQLIILNRINLTGEKEDKKIKDQKFKILNKCLAAFKGQIKYNELLPSKNNLNKVNKYVLL